MCYIEIKSVTVFMLISLETDGQSIEGLDQFVGLGKIVSADSITELYIARNINSVVIDFCCPNSGNGRA